ncbi:hypothetical protein SSX86_026773 [Deinandra increscens subsp. villosa]|uniref:Uncharacterized protein n=1 Tax=Deinandra increscens subsp. villosa TaxID=3103831 RepID=A0AAP0CLS4_9ASTR
MMIRSSSTPILGSLLPETPNNHHHDVTLLHPYKSYSSPIHNKLSFHQTPSSPGSHHFTTLSCNSSPISPSFAGNNGGGIRRVQSEGNLESLMTSAGNDADDSDFSFFNPPKKLSSRLHHTCPLETIPSFSYQNSRFRSSDEEDDDDIDEGFGGFNVENCKVLRVNNKEMGFGDLGVKDHDDGIIGETGSQMYLAKGLGIDAGFGCGSGGGGRNLSHVGGEGAAGGGGGGGDVEEEHYRKMVNECPGNALLLRNYAQFLYQSKHDLEGAEEYYSRAILVDPNDGEILSQYAKLLWELHRDRERATTYFERAIQAASEDSHVHAAYASFLWETEEDEEEEEQQGYNSNIPTLFNNGKMASAATS